MRAKFNEAVVVLGSAAPSLESWTTSERGALQAHRDAHPRDEPGRCPVVELVGMRTEFEEPGKEEIFRGS